MENVNDAQWIRVAVALAQQARDRGDEPFGALLVHNGASIMEARNAVNTDRDVTQHAELRLISKASRFLDPAVIAASMRPVAHSRGNAAMERTLPADAIG